MEAVFTPLFAESDEVLEEEAAECYNRLDSAELDRKSVAALQEVFVSWLMRRLPFKGAKEIEEMLLGPREGYMCVQIDNRSNQKYRRKK